MDVHQLYLEDAIKMHEQFPGNILKTDTWNEANKCFPILLPDTSYIEIDKDTVDKANDNFNINAISGDIRQLPYKEQFNLVLDLSTIDHIPDYEKAITEYHRVLKPNGGLFIVVWLADKTYKEQSPGWIQYYFDENQFESCLTKHFKVLEKHQYPNMGIDTKFLRKYICQKI